MARVPGEALGAGHSELGGLQSDRNNVLVMKFCASALWLFATAAMSKGDWLSWRILFAVPFGALFLFHLSLAVVRVRGGALQYRRFLTWSTIDRRDVISSGVVWPPALGYIRLNRFLSPWGRLYFVLDTDRSPSPFGRGDYGLLRYLANHSRRGNSDPTGPGRPSSRADWLKLWAAGTAGAALSFLRISLSRTSDRSASTFHTQHQTVISAVRGLQQLLAHSWQAQMALFAIFALLAVYARGRPKAWTLAFLAGVLSPFLLFRWLTG